MYKRFWTYIGLAFLLTFAGFCATAQEDDNLLPNGSFEEIFDKNGVENTNANNGVPAAATSWKQWINGGDELITKIKGGWLGFDKAVATPDMMGAVGKIGKILGPRGLMPNAKLGTVTFDLDKVIREIKAGKIDFRVEKSGIVHAPVGRVSFGADKILENIATFMDTIVRLKPAASKGTYIRGIAISTTMGPGIKIDPAAVKALL